MVRQVYGNFQSNPRAKCVNDDDDERQSTASSRIKSPLSIEGYYKCLLLFHNMATTTSHYIEATIQGERHASNSTNKKQTLSITLLGLEVS